MATERNESETWDRRKGGDRRQQQVAIDFADRRKGERRSGLDRRKTPRS